MEKIYEILNNIKPEGDFRNAKNYIEEGLMDSMEMIELISELEENYDIVIDPMDIIPENFENVEKIYNLIVKNGGK